MPIYEYKCNDCGLEFEVMQRFSDAPVKECEDCGGAVEKMISLSSFHLKGGGWYATEYGNKKKDSEPAGCGDGTGARAEKPDCKGCPSAQK
ncbi:hypothetical protein MNBD_DELTA02-495 [hydrothermal vent metagenome]|uniref:Putative regulatory protein FmdB zinc ribbon domain-containing protein n=1 Tax=hydrothermal vent metagenome TaxID=652676 RepID=A0A3B0V1V3_9ZZZZ